MIRTTRARQLRSWRAAHGERLRWQRAPHLTEWRVLLVLLLTFSFLSTVRAVGPVKYWYTETGTLGSSCADIAGTTDPGKRLSWAATWACMAGGDTFHMKAGSYTQQLYEFTISIPNGISAAAPTIIEGEGAIGCALAQTCSTILTSDGHNIENGQYITLRNFAINGSGQNRGSCFRFNNTTQTTTQIIVDNLHMHHCSIHGVFISNLTASITFRNFTINDTCTMLPECDSIEHIGGHGMYLSADDVLVENFHMFNIPTPAQVTDRNSIGIQFYTDAGTDSADRAIIRYGEIHDVRDSDGLILKSVNAQAYGLLIHHNTRGITHYGGSTATGCKNGNKVHNNVLYSNSIAFQVGLFSGSGCTNGTVEFSNNIVVGGTGWEPNSWGWTSSGSKNATTTCGAACGSANVAIAAITDITVSTSDFHHKVGSVGINAGTSVSTRVCNGVCDIGPYETFGFSAASIGTSIMDVTLGMSLYTPLSPASGITGFSVACTGTNCGTPTISSAVRLSDTIVRLTLSGIGGGSNACAAGQTWTVSYSPGNVKDTSTIGSTSGQSMFAFSTQPVTNSCGGGTTPPPGTPLIYYKFDDGSGTTAVDTNGGDNNGTLSGSPLPTWVTGKYGGALRFAGQTVNDYVATGYGSGINPTTQSLTICMGVLPSDATQMLTNTGIIGVPYVAGQSLYLSWDNTGTGTITYGFGIQGNGSGSAPSEFAITPNWTRLCLVVDAAIDTATLYVNGVKGTSALSVKTYTSFTLPGNFEIGWPSGASSGGGFDADEFKLWVQALTDTEVTNDYLAWEPPSQPTVGTFAQVTHQWQKFRKTAGGTPELMGAAGATVNVVGGASVQFVAQTDCTVGNCDPIAQRVVYNRNSGAFIPLPDTLTADNVMFAGVTQDTSVVSGAVTCCLTGALTANDGTTVFTSSAIPNFDLTLNSSIVQRYAIQFGTSVVVGDTYCFKVQNQNGTAFTTYTPSAGACVTIAAVAMGTAQ